MIFDVDLWIIIMFPFPYPSCVCTCLFFRYVGGCGRILGRDERHGDTASSLSGFAVMFWSCLSPCCSPVWFPVVLCMYLSPYVAGLLRNWLDNDSHPGFVVYVWKMFVFSLPHLGTMDYPKAFIHNSRCDLTTVSCISTLHSLFIWPEVALIHS